MSTLANVGRVQEETKEVTSVEKGHDVERVVGTSVAVKLAREQVQQTELWTIPVVRGKWRLQLSREACVFLKPVTSKLSWFSME